MLHHLQELETARRESIDVTVCVVGEPFEWKKVAEGFDIAGIEVTGRAELMAALEKADKGHGAVVIDMTRFE